MNISHGPTERSDGSTNVGAVCGQPDKTEVGETELLTKLAGTLKNDREHPLLTAAPIPSVRSLALMAHLETVARECATGHETTTTTDSMGLHASAMGPEQEKCHTLSDLDKPFSQKRFALLCLAGAFAVAMIGGVTVSFGYSLLLRPASQQIATTVDISGDVPPAESLLQDPNAEFGAVSAPEIQKKMDSLAHDLAVFRQELKDLVATQDRTIALTNQLKAAQGRLSSAEEALVAKQGETLQGTSKSHSEPEQRGQRVNAQGRRQVARGDAKQRASDGKAIGLPVPQPQHNSRADLKPSLPVPPRYAPLDYH